MTDNEKAAAFIGWKPEQVCEWCDKDEDRRQQLMLMTQMYQRQVMHFQHPLSAPDMSKPENYMRACFAVCRDKSFEVTFCIDGGGPCVLVTDFSEKVLSTNDEDWGGAAVAALAALYDAENAK